MGNFVFNAQKEWVLLNEYGYNRISVQQEERCRPFGSHYELLWWEPMMIKMLDWRTMQ